MFDQRQLDLVGLALVALGVFLAFVFYGDWNGGQVGGALADGLRYLVGVTAYVVPAALVAGGVIVVLRPFLPNSRPFAAGALCLFAALTLALTAGTFGLGPGGARRVSRARTSRRRPGAAAPSPGPARTRPPATPPPSSRSAPPR